MIPPSVNVIEKKSRNKNIFIALWSSSVFI